MTASTYDTEAVTREATHSLPTTPLQGREIIVWTALLYNPHPRGARLQRLRGQVLQRKEIDITPQANIHLNAKKPDDFESHQVPLLCLQRREGWMRRHLSNRTKDCHSCPYVDKAVIKAKLEEQYPTDKWEHSYIDASGGYIVTEHERIAESQESKQALGVYRKEQDMARDLAKMGHQIEHLGENNRPKGDRYDTLFDGVKADLKSTRSHNNIVKYGKKAFREQGADMVVYRLEQHTEGMLKELKNLKELFPDKRIVYYYQDEQRLREL